MGTRASLHCAPEHRDRAVERLDELEERWSRFLPDSDIDRLSGGDGRAVAVSSDTIELVDHMVRAWEVTQGDFDPALLGTICELGYDTSRHDPSRRSATATGADPTAGLVDVVIDRVHSTVTVPRGLGLDPGGIGKGLAADIVAREAMERGATGILVDVGGDLRVMGRPDTSEFWTIDLRDPTDSQVIGQIRLRDGGVATSTSRLRTWERSGEHHHHLLDPRTRRSSTNGVMGCTVVAGTAAWAEVFTKVAFVRPVEEALAAYREHGLAARLTLDDGRTLTTPAWKDFEG